MTAALATIAWSLSNAPAWWRYRRALESPALVQERLLLGYVRRNAGTAFGRSHGFDRIRTIADYQARVPLMRYGDVEPFIRRIADGEARVLTAEPVRRLAVTGGSTSGPKLIPYTAALHAEYARGVGPWIVDLYRTHPGLAGGPAFWSITPRVPVPRLGSGAVPIGFEEDSRYLGGLAHRLVDRAMAVPGCLAEVADHAAHRYLTLLLLLRQPGLRLISVWHPSYLTLLLDALARDWEALVGDVRSGGATLPGRLPSAVAASLGRRLQPDVERADNLRAAGPARCDRIWPELRLVSCWGDGAARELLPEVRRRLPGVRVQPKGLLATEAIVTIPFGAAADAEGPGGRPLAVRSHFFEFVAPDGTIVLAHELEPGAVYEVVVTTGGGLYRYRLGDRVHVDGFAAKTPSLTFVGREAQMSDLVGEKLHEAFVADVIAGLFRGARAPSFAMLVPDREGARSRYTLFVETAHEPAADLDERLERGLRKNPHYALAVDLGQLAPAHAQRVREGFETFLRHQAEQGRRLGDVKPVALHAGEDWAGRFTRVEPRETIRCERVRAC